MLNELAQMDRATTSAVIARAVERYWHERMLQRANDAWSAIMADAEAAAEVREEDTLWAETDTDGIEDLER